LFCNVAAPERSRRERTALLFVAIVTGRNISAGFHFRGRSGYGWAAHRTGSRFERRTRSTVMHSLPLLPTLSCLAVGVVLVELIGCDPIDTFPKLSSALSGDDAGQVDRFDEAMGRTECAPGRKGMIAPVPLHPVVEVLVNPGDRVKKGQALVKLDDDEARAEVRVKRAALENARINLNEARRYLGALEKASSSVPDVAQHKARVAALEAETLERAAEAAWESAQAELQHYVVTAPIDGVVSWLDVSPGMVSRPGTTLWGEILDLREIDVRCELTIEQADRISVGSRPTFDRAKGIWRAGPVEWSSWGSRPTSRQAWSLSWCDLRTRKSGCVAACPSTCVSARRKDGETSRKVTASRQRDVPSA
jgi:biotin carboxyl carrier protein